MKILVEPRTRTPEGKKTGTETETGTEANPSSSQPANHAAGVDRLLCLRVAYTVQLLLRIIDTSNPMHCMELF